MPGSWPNSAAVSSCPRSGSPTRASRSASARASACTSRASAPASSAHATLMTHGRPCPVDLFAARTPRPARAVVGYRRRQSSPHRRARARDRHRARAARARRRPSLRPAAERPRHRLGARVHDRGRDRRHRSLPLACQARRLHGPLSPRLPVGGERPPRGWARTAPATCAGRWSRRPVTPAGIPPTGSATSGRAPAWAGSAAPASRRSTSPAAWLRQSGTCSPATAPSLRQAPLPP